MQTNREYLLENPEVMLNAMVLLGGAGDALGVCKWRDEQKIKCISKMCSNCIAEWLDAEHIEPDSLEKIKDDASPQKSTEEYWRCEGLPCVCCPHEIIPSDKYGVLSCTMAIKLDIISRCEKVLGK